jgi:asparagine synthase (glutamine-hydrolysing)
VPNIHWIDSIKLFLKKKILTDDAIFINGQSGDFVAGNHIPIVKTNSFNVELLCGKIMQKHFSLLTPYLNEKDFAKRISEKIIETITSCLDLSINGYQDFAKYYELWEWQERQCKRVINGQRTYDFYGFSWRLPLWADEWLYFWESIPLKHKLQRNLFRKYVEKMDFFGLFKKFKPILSRWPGKLIILQYVGNSINLLLGEKPSKRYYRYLDYFSQYSNFYAPFSYREYVRICQDCKDAMPLFGEVWRYENLNRRHVILK